MSPMLSLSHPACSAVDGGSLQGKSGETGKCVYVCVCVSAHTRVHHVGHPSSSHDSASSQFEVAGVDSMQRRLHSSALRRCFKLCHILPLPFYFSIAGALPEEFLSHTNTFEEVRPVCMTFASSPLCTRYCLMHVVTSGQVQVHTYILHLYVYACTYFSIIKRIYNQVDP